MPTPDFDTLEQFVGRPPTPNTPLDVSLMRRPNYSDLPDRKGATRASDVMADRIKKVTPICRYWGTAWAAIGLAESLPAAQQQADAN